MTKDRHAWRNYVMPLIGPSMVASRQTTRQLRRKNDKRQRAADWLEDQNSRAQALEDRVYARQAAGKAPVQWPSWWKGRPTGVL